MRLQHEAPITTLVQNFLGLKLASSWFESPRLGITHPAVTVPCLAVAEERGAAGQAVFLILPEDADALGSHLGWWVEPALCHLPSPTAAVCRLEAVPEKAPSALLGWGLQLLPILKDLLQHPATVGGGDFEPDFAGPPLLPLIEFLLLLIHY